VDQTNQELQSALLAAFQLGMQGQWVQAAELVRRYADEGENSVAIAAMAVWLANAGQWQQGLPYAEKAIDGSVAVGPIATNYGNLLSADANYRDRSARFFQRAIEAGWTIDPFAQAQTMIQQGNASGAIDLLENARSRTLTQLQGAWERLNRDVTQSQQRLDTELKQVSESRVAQIAQMTEDAAFVRGERDRVTQLVSDTTSLLQNVAADNLASEYAERAKTSAERADRWTKATIAVSVLAIVVAATFVLVGLANHHDVGTVLARAAISLPLLALAAYLNKLGTDERRDVRNWTHIELQIRTARPYLGNLPEAMRDEVQAALALRFFPGQAQDPHGGTAVDSDPDDALRLIRDLLARQEHGVP